ncbi:MAG: hypothetical protein HFH92_08290 [Lachnospiraceae bacterium]|uniref:hypothetical protein n=1 Tax=uncultured Acetatifactor sp. TaxID=1671927 RepID=UPI002615D179|nr:hypothetical protein [uncultured Acetatifactor sp.]MCI8789091.1 hypothetical protein [Lachnospiraceae bacterium]
MKSELRRALFKKSNIVLMISVVSLMIINAYYGGWRTALKIDSAQDIRNIEDVIFYKKYHGNMYRVWKDSYYMIQTLAPVILAAPYLNSYLSEKANRFRFFCVSRKGNLKYIVQKGLAIALSGTAVLAFSEMLFAVITGLLTQHDISIEFIQGIVSFKEDFFLDNPLLYFVLIYISHVIYYFCFMIFSLGITSFLNNKIAVIVVPFIIAAVLDTILPTALQPNVAMQPYREGFRIGGYVVLIGIYVIAGSVLLMVSEKWYLKRGTFL